MEQQFGIQQGTELPPSLPGTDIPQPLYRTKVRKERSVWRQYLDTVLIAVLIAILLRLFVVSAYRVSSGSMEDTLIEGDYIFVNKLAYQYSTPKAGDVIVFENPFDASKDYIKRIAAVEGQTVEIIDKTLYIDGSVAPIPEMSKNTDPKIFPAVLSVRDNFGPILVPAGQYFVMGDNRDNSQDSRFWGCVDKSYIKGRATFIYFSYAPDPNAPKWKAPYILEFFQVLFYNIFAFSDRVRLERIGKPL